jgi:hypothetical protein
MSQIEFAIRTYGTSGAKFSQDVNATNYNLHLQQFDILEKEFLDEQRAAKVPKPDRTKVMEGICRELMSKTRFVSCFSRHTPSSLLHHTDQSRHPRLRTLSLLPRRVLVVAQFSSRCFSPSSLLHTYSSQ